jgi:alpha/beta superfamily hydrolase
MKVLRRRIRNADGEILRGDLHFVENAQDIVIVCHGFGKTWNKNRHLYRTICYTFQKAGIHAFRFSFSGSFPSEGKAEESCYTKQQSDLAAVIDYISMKIHPRRITIIAHSFSSAAAILQAAKDPRIHCLLLVAPRLDCKKSITTMTIETQYGKRIEEILASHATVYPIGPIRLGGFDYFFSRHYLEDLAYTNLFDVIAQLSIPITIIRGELDQKISEKEIHTALMQNSHIVFISLSACGHSFRTPIQKATLCQALLDSYVKTFS